MKAGSSKPPSACKRRIRRAARVGFATLLSAATNAAAADLVVAADPASGEAQQRALGHGVEPEPDKEQQRALEHGVEPSSDRADEDDEEATGPRPGVGAGVRGSFGRVFTRDVDPGWYGRLEMEAYSAGSYRAAGPVGGALIGGEFWSAPGATGGGLPMGFYFGVRSPAVISTLGGGFQMFIVDEVDDDGGFGIYAPYAAFTLGVEAGGVRVLAEGRAQFRWQWGAEDRGQLQLGLSVAHVWESKLKSRRHRGPHPVKACFGEKC